MAEPLPNPVLVALAAIAVVGLNVRALRQGRSTFCATLRHWRRHHPILFWVGVTCFAVHVEDGWGSWDLANRAIALSL